MGERKKEEEGKRSSARDAAAAFSARKSSSFCSVCRPFSSVSRGACLPFSAHALSNVGRSKTGVFSTKIKHASRLFYPVDVAVIIITTLYLSFAETKVREKCIRATSAVPSNLLIIRAISRGFACLIVAIYAISYQLLTAPDRQVRRTGETYCAPLATYASAIRELNFCTGQDQGTSRYYNWNAKYFQSAIVDDSFDNFFIVCSQSCIQRHANAKKNRTRLYDVNYEVENR